MDHSDKFAEKEPEVKEYIRSLSRSDIFYDLGACSGYFSIYASQYVKKVFSFEPEPENYLLCKNRCNGFDNIKTFNIAITDGSQNQVEMRVGQDFPGGHHKTIITDTYCGQEEIVKQGYKKIIVEASSLDNFIINNNIPAPTSMKIDIDGSEYDFLIGAKTTLKAVNSLMIEINYESQYYDKIIKLLTGYDFTLYKHFPLKQTGCDGLYNCWYTKCG